MLGLALEGGGAKGAYEIGAYRALTELGYHFDVICGVSIGAINAALLAQGDCEKAAEFWETTANDDLFSEEDKGFLEIINRQVNLNTLSALKENIKAALENGGIDTSKIRAFLEQNIDPQRLLESPIDYGMIAVAFPELQPLISRLQEQNRTIRTQLSELSTRQREFDAITENMREGFLIVDDKCNILSSNRSALRLLGIDGTPKPENLHQAVCSGELLTLVDAALDGTRGDEELSFGGGTWQLYANPVITGSRVTGAILIFMDVTEREQREALRREFSANVSHELKTPLTSIVNYVDLLKKEDIPSPEAREYIAVLDRQSHRLKKLTEDLVEASKASSGVLNVDLQPTDVNVLFSQIEGEYQERLAACQLTLVTQPPAPGTVIRADSRLLSRVMDNLVSNICKYALPSTRVYVVSTLSREAVTISFKNVSRDELNISPDELMERFVRGDASRHTEGSGLGLSIARSLVQLQGGRFDLAIDADLFRADITFPLSESAAS